MTARANDRLCRPSESLDALLVFPVIEESGDYRRRSRRRKMEAGMNLGLLAIATHLQREGLTCRIADLNQQRAPYSYLQRILKRLRPLLVGISCNSPFDYISAMAAARCAKAVLPGGLVAVGGIQAGNMVEETFRESRDVDVISYGEGEVTTEQLVRHCRDGAPLREVEGIAFLGDDGAVVHTAPPTCLPLDAISHLEYELYPNYRKFIPLVEEARGCPSQCDFCSIPGFHRQHRRKSPDVLASEIRRVLDLWGSTSCQPVVLVTPDFGLDARDTSEFFSEILDLKGRVVFSAATRVDAPWDGYLPHLSKFFNTFSFGLESGSPTMLRVMHKTRTPEAYLARAAEAFREFHARGIHVNVNIMLGEAGETPTTVRETVEFLLANRSNIDTLWACTPVYFPGCPISKKIEHLRRVHHCEVIPNPWGDRVGFQLLHPSLHFTNDQLRVFCLCLMKMFNAEEKFYHKMKWFAGHVEDGDFLTSQTVMASLFRSSWPDPRLAEFEPTPELIDSLSAEES